MNSSDQQRRTAELLKAASEAADLHSHLLKEKATLQERMSEFQGFMNDQQDQINESEIALNKILDELFAWLNSQPVEAVQQAKPVSAEQQDLIPDLWLSPNVLIDLPVFLDHNFGPRTQDSLGWICWNVYGLLVSYRFSWIVGPLAGLSDDAAWVHIQAKLKEVKNSQVAKTSL
jgi:hypothetical protein